MKLANICPPDLLNDVLGDDPQETYHLVLADLILENETYRRFYQDRYQRGDFIIIDNGAHEYTVAQTAHHLVEAYRALTDVLKHPWMGMVEIVLPDVARGPGRDQDTIAYSREAAPVIQRILGQVPLMVVPHGDWWAQYFVCAEKLLEIPGVESIGVSDDETLIIAEGDRERVATYLYSRFNKPLHYLGMLETLHDLGTPWARTYVRGVDGCKLVRWGLNGVKVDPQTPPPPYPGRGAEYFSILREDVSDETLGCIRWNIETWRNVVEYGRNPS